MPVQITVEGELAVLRPNRNSDSNPDRVVISAREEVRRLISEEINKIVVDCSELDFLSSTEVGAMIGAMREINQVQGAIIFTGVGVRLAEIFEVMRILQVLPIRLTTREAMLELGKLRREPNLLAKLTAANPTLEHINAWWDGKMGLGLEANPTANSRLATPPPAEAAIRPEDEETLFGRKSVSMTDRITAIPTSDPWNEALGIIRSAQSLCENQGLEFRPTMTFQEFLGNLSMKLPLK